MEKIEEIYIMIRQEITIMDGLFYSHLVGCTRLYETIFEDVCVYVKCGVFFIFISLLSVSNKYHRDTAILSFMYQTD